MCMKESYVANQQFLNDTSLLKGLLDNLKKCEGFTNSTMNSYTTLKKVIIDNANSFANLSTACNKESNSNHYNNLIRSLNENDEFVKFNGQIHSETLKHIELLANETKALQKKLEGLKSNQKAYESIRKKINKKEAKYTKANKSLSESTSYHKQVEKRNSLKSIGESLMEEYEASKANLLTNISETLLTAYNNYLESTSNFTIFIGNALKENIHSGNVFQHASQAYAL